MRKKRVLYAEDDLGSRKLLEIKLKKAGVDCDSAENGILALKMYADDKYDLVVLDHNMPELNGEEVAAEIRKSSADIPIIAITSDDTLKRQLLDSGFDEVIVKPIHGTEAIDTIKSYL